ncbi:hypothetical protein N7478_000018 [Penicillium angulare]|uniref:uncharacterized protein n=1 Tax=Penicillium angulare TaxID=116970 RepID=UPI0025415756|nr:uncharacterized protein N7478_000018 [Penicillium angulare]KAJ5290767.1 hypothetical protein N7478_000018 [Penicillium angulare]
MNRHRWTKAQLSRERQLDRTKHEVEREQAKFQMECMANKVENLQQTVNLLSNDLQNPKEQLTPRVREARVNMAVTHGVKLNEKRRYRQANVYLSLIVDVASSINFDLSASNMLPSLSCPTRTGR